MFGLAVTMGGGCSDNATAPDAGDPDGMPPDGASDGAPDAASAELRGAMAHWVAEGVMAVPGSMPGDRFELHHSTDAGIAIDFTANTVEGSDVVALTVDGAGLPQAIEDEFPHLAGYKALALPATGVDVAAVLKAQLAVVGVDTEGNLVSATAVQIPGVLDDLFAYDGPLGVTFEDTSEPRTPTFRLWAPTARSVILKVYAADDKRVLAAHPMTESSEHPGVWVHPATDDSWYGHYYRFEVSVFTYRDTANPGSATAVPGGVVNNLVTDPYSVGLASNSVYSLIIDLDDPVTKPSGWDELGRPENFEAPEDIVLYEVHIGDFSAHDESVAEEHRGKYLAFTYDGSDGNPLSDGMAHLQRLAHPVDGDPSVHGVTHVHLLPAFDIATIDEIASRRIQLDSTFGTLCEAVDHVVPAGDCLEDAGKPLRRIFEELLATSELGEGVLGDTEDIQAVLDLFRNRDGYNWGYDPFHYTTPEGSYATDPDGTGRILEMRQMVMGLKHSDLRVVMDVVYNHTAAAGQSDRSVLDKIVPGYYHRQNIESGDIEHSTCCENTATEHVMMEKLMLDSLEVWATQYQIDGFRFDLMGHHMKSNMEKVVATMTAIDPTIYVYGEGWDFGEVGGNARGENATQLNLAGTGIGTFNDRLRDAVRGGGPFDSGIDLRRNQGFINGMSYQPNEANTASAAEQLAALERQADLIRVSMAGNLKRIVIPSRFDLDLRGEDIDYNGYAAGYCDDPQEAITYVSAHDNQTLFDNNQYKIPTGVSMSDRVRIQNLGISFAVLGQGIPFLHMGSDILRSKSMSRDSYDYGDWYNRVDFGYADSDDATTNWNVGLPAKDKDGDNYGVIRQIIADESIAPRAVHMRRAHDHAREMLAVRASSPLFRLRTGAQIETRVDFHNGAGPDRIPGLIVMTITDGSCAGDQAADDLDPALDNVVVLLNANDEQATFDIAGTPLDGKSWSMTEALTHSSDPQLANATFDLEGNHSFVIPARTTAVFVDPQTAGSRDAGICNVRVAREPPPRDL